VADGVVPSNEERGYVLRRIIRRAVRHAFLLGAEDLVTPALVNATVDVTGDDAFFLHDTLGFPIDLTREIAEERGRTVDIDGFHARMQEQRTRAKEAHKAAGGKGEGAPLELYRELADELGPTDFTGRQEYETVGAKVRALIGGRDRLAQASVGDPVSVVLDRTPFYA